MPLFPAPGAEQGPVTGKKAIPVDLVLRTGGRLAGKVLDHSEHGVVVLSNDKPFVLAWGELEAGSAYATRRRLLVAVRGDEASLTGEDHFALGVFARRQGRNDLASNEFRSAIRQDESFRDRIRDVLQADDRSRSAKHQATDSCPPAGPDPAETQSRKAGSTRRPETDPWVQPAPCMTEPPELLPPLSAASYEQVMAVYRQFGEKVQEILGDGIGLVESDHFLIWTDWERLQRDRLAEWCEAMYAALCAEFSLSPTDRIFLAKCPVFCWRSKARFIKFARLFDGYRGSEATGYTRSIARNGHVHVVLLRQGRSAADFDGFAHTLVHEGTHAFLHRLYTPRLIPHWISEGYAELMAERVLGDRCPSGEKAQLLAKQYARFGWPVADFLASTEPLELHQYALAHSLVSYLEGLGADRFVGLFKDLKNGSTFSDALRSRYDGMTVDRFEQQWRKAVGETDAD